MEDQRNSFAKTDDSNEVEPQSLRVPSGYSRLKRELQKRSSISGIFQSLEARSKNSADISEFCQALLTLKEFDSFKTIHFFKHEKGQSFAVKHEVALDSISTKDFHVNEFNTLYQRIKKSKNRTFGQESLKGFTFDILGTFLAREFSLDTHNIIIIVSRNDFLSQTQLERDLFNKVMSVVSAFFDKILRKELEAQQLQNIQLALEHLPFQVETSTSARPEFKRLPSDNFYQIKTEQTLDKADIFHQERIALLGELLNTLKHELSNPLFGLQLSAELLLMDLDDEDNLTFMNEISSSIKRSQSIIANFTELYTSNETLRAKDLEKLASEVFTLTKSESRQIKKSFHIQELEHEDFVINANSVWLAQILFNLVVNSAQALNSLQIPSPEIQIKAYLKNPVEIHVIDNGPGAPEEVMKNMFSPFYTTKEKGTGLGLAISQSLAKKLNGKIDYISKGQGAHFVLKLDYENTGC
ncbi:MAG: HAMP domain-containing histidine kinase [Bacteriovoracaceae bacterium]|nr:HAMP domain-containing histidine kinase [Bacteriovoracaceae bacterium]